MEYNSFYGGRKGASFVIVKRYDSILQMTADFGKGTEFTDVNFDQYVIIDTINKNNPDNGKLFRRGYDFDSNRQIVHRKLGNDVENTSESSYLTLACGAEYVGTISGPSGKAPTLRLTDIGNIRYLRYGYNYIIRYLMDLNYKFNKIYDEYYNIVAGTTARAYDIEIGHLQDEKNDVDNIDSLSQEQKTKIKAEIDDVINKYQDLKNNLLNSLPGLQAQIDTYYNDLNQYVYLIEDQTDERFYQNGQWKYDRVIDQQDFIKYKIELVNVYGQQTYHLRDESILELTDEDTSYEEGQYDTQQWVDIVPGKTYDETTGQAIYNDAIQYASITIPDDNDNTAQAWIGFKFPYLVNEFNAQDTDQYDTNGDRTNKTNITRDDDYLHPFYQHWTIDVPIGIKGDSYQNLRLYDVNNKKYLYATKRVFDNKRAGQTTDVQIGPYTIIKNIINNSSTGQFTINFTNEVSDLPGNDKTQYNGQFDYVKGIEINKKKDGTDQEGTVTFKHTIQTSDEEFSKVLKLVKQLNKINDYKYDLVYNITDENNQPVKDTFLFNYVNQFKFERNQNDGVIAVRYRTTLTPSGEQGGLEEDHWHTLTDTDIQNIERFVRFEFNAATGQLSVIWDRSDSGGAAQDPEILGTIIYPTDMQLLSNGKIRVTYSDGHTEDTDDARIIYPVSFSYTDNTGQFSYVDNTGASHTINGILQHPNILTYTDNTGKLTVTSNIGNSSDIGTISYPNTLNYNANTGQLSYLKNNDSNLTAFTGDTLSYVTGINRQKDNTNKNYKLRAATNQGANLDIYTLNKSVNEMHVTEYDYHVVVRYNDLDKEDWTTFGLIGYQGADTTYLNSDWVDLGPIGEIQHQYDIVVVNDDTDLNDISLKEGGIALIFDGDDPNPNPYDGSEQIPIEEIKVETYALSSLYEEHIEDYLPPNFAETGVIFIYDVEPQDGGEEQSINPQGPDQQAETDITNNDDNNTEEEINP